MSMKTALSLVAILLTLIVFIPYIISILNRTTRPHVFSWFIWALTTVIVFFAQMSAGGGVGAWPIGFSGTMSGCIACLAYLRRSDISITKLDWFFFIMACLALPLWFVTQNPTASVILLTGIDLLGFGPTYRKVMEDPYSENVLFFIIFSVRNLMVVLALEHYSWATVFFPLVIMIACLGVVLLLLSKRILLRRAIR